MFDESLSVNKSNCCFVLHELKTLARGARYARYFDLGFCTVNYQVMIFIIGRMRDLASGRNLFLVAAFRRYAA